MGDKFLDFLLAFAAMLLCLVPSATIARMLLAPLAGLP